MPPVWPSIPVSNRQRRGLRRSADGAHPPRRQGCYRCLWPESDEPQRNCRTAGIVGPVVGMMGTLQALETIKLLSGMATPRNTLRLFDARTSNWRALALQRSRSCPVCGGRHADLV